MQSPAITSLELGPTTLAALEAALSDTVAASAFLACDNEPPVGPSPEPRRT